MARRKRGEEGEQPRGDGEETLIAKHLLTIPPLPFSLFNLNSFEFISNSVH